MVQLNTFVLRSLLNTPVNNGDISRADFSFEKLPLKSAGTYNTHTRSRFSPLCTPSRGLIHECTYTRGRGEESRQLYRQPENVVRETRRQRLVHGLTSDGRGRGGRRGADSSGADGRKGGEHRGEEIGMRSAQRVHTRPKGGPKPQSKGCASRDEEKKKKTKTKTKRS